MLSTAARFVASRGYREDALDQLAAYAELASVEATLLVQDAKQRLVWTLAAVVLGIVAFTLLGVAAMLVSSVAGGGLGANPALWIVPLVALVVAALAAGRASTGSTEAPFAALRAQLAADIGRARADPAEFSKPQAQP